MLFTVDQRFQFIITIAENVTLHKYIAQTGRNSIRAISETVGNSFLISSQTSFNDLLKDILLGN